MGRIIIINLTMNAQISNGVNQSKNIIIGIIAVLAVGAIILFANLNPQDSQRAEKIPDANGILIAEEKNFDFGTISMSKGNVSHAFKIKNESESAVSIKKIYTSCMFTSALIIDASGKKYGPFGMPGHGGGSPIANIEIKPNESVEVKAEFDPAAHGPSGVGLAKRTIYIETNSEKTPKIELEISAMVTK